MQITTDDLLQAAQIEERGMLDRKERSPDTWRQVAINEAAMAVVAVNFPDLKNIEFVGSLISIVFLLFLCPNCVSQLHTQDSFHAILRILIYAKI